MASAGLKLFREGGLYVLGLALLRGGGLILVPVYTALLTEEEFGAFGVIRHVVNLLVILAVASQGYSLLRLGADVEGDEGSASALVSSIFSYVAIASLVLAGSAALLWPVLGSQVDDLPLWPLGIAGLSIVLFEPLFRLCLAWLQFHGRAGTHTAISTVRWAVFMGLVLLFLLGLGWKAEGVLLGMGLSFAVGTVLGIRQVTGLRPRIDRRVLAASLIYGLPILPHALSGIIFQATDQILLAAHDDHGLSAAGLYLLAVNLASGVFMVAMGMQKAWLPFFMREDRDRGSLGWERVRKLSFFSISVVSCAAVGVGVLAPEFVKLGSLFSENSYAAAATVVPILGFGAFLRSYYLVTSAVVMADKGMARWIAGATLPAAALNILLNTLWIPEYGMVGAAWATFTSHCLAMALTVLMARKARKVPFKYGRAAVLAVMVGGTLYLAQGLDLLPRIGMIVAFGVALLALDGRDLTGAARSVLKQRASKRGGDAA
jgi:O-antigen/teichoic acid export membrane protein